MGLFNLDSKFSQFLSRVCDLMILNLVFVFTSIPVITIGANFTALYYVTLKMIKNDESYIWKSYWKSWRQNFLQATAIWLIFLFIFVFIIFDILIVNQMPGSAIYLKYVFLVLLFIWGMIVTYLFPVLSRFDNTVKNTIRNSLLMSIRHLPWTVVMLAINILPAIIFIFAPPSMSSLSVFLMFILGFSCVALANSWFFVNKVFPYYMPSKEEETLTELEESNRVLEAMDQANPDFLENSGRPESISANVSAENMDTENIDTENTNTENADTENTNT